MNRKGAIDFLHRRGYSRRISAKLADIAVLAKSSKPFEFALKIALEKATEKDGNKNNRTR